MLKDIVYKAVVGPEMMFRSEWLAVDRNIVQSMIGAEITMLRGMSGPIRENLIR